MKSSILKDTRESKGLTLEMVHETTKIPLDALRAIEEGYSIRILTPFYYKGFVKNYAEFLGLDVDLVFKEYNLDRATKPHVPVPPPERPIPRQVREKMVGPAAHFLTPRKIAMILKVVGVIICLFIAFKVLGWVGGKIKSAFFKPRQQKVQVKDVKKPVVKKPQEKKQPPKPEARKKEVSVPVATVEEEIDEVVFVEEKTTSNSKQENSIAQKVRLTVKAKKDSWLRVKSDGSVVFQSTLRKGSSESWGADEEIELSGKNINLLEFEVNGKLLGQLGPSDRKARKVIITKDGLSVKK